MEGGRIYVTDVDQLLAYDLNSRELLFTLDFSGEGTRFLNDIAVKDKHTLFVSATDLGKIYRVKIGKNPSYRALDVEVKGPNGLYSIGNALYVAGFGSNNQPNGQLGVIRFHGKKAEYQVLSDLQGYLDGVAVTPAGNVWFSDWVAFEKQGVMRVYDKASKTVAILPMSEKLSGPADFLLDEKTQMLWIPEMMAGKIRLQKRPDL